MKKFYFLITTVLISLTTYASNFGSLSYGYAINLAGKQRVLSQRITKMTLLKANHLETNDLNYNLEASISSFTTNYHTLLRNAEKSDKEFVTILKEELKRWNIFLVEVRKFEGGDMISLLSKSKALLKVCHKFALKLEAEANFSSEAYNATEDLILQTSTVTISNKQRMLSQQFGVYYLAGYLYGMEEVFSTELKKLRKQQSDDLSFLIFNSVNNEIIEEQFMEVTMLFELLDKYQNMTSNISVLKVISFCDRITTIFDEITNNYTKLYEEMKTEKHEDFSSLTSTNK